ALLFPERTGMLPKALANELILKSQGNPFFIEELINYLHDRGLNPYEVRALEVLELPASLQTLILSRMDQLTEPLKVTLKVASVIGRIFPFSWLYGYYPSLGEESLVKDHLAQLSRLDLTPLDTPDPELAYLFKHIVTQEVAYESLAYTTRAHLHELLARYLEATYAADLPIEVLAYHYNRSNNLAKKREYLRKSGDAARIVYSNAAALDYYRQALAALPEPEEAIDLHLHSGTVFLLIGESEQARNHFQQALQIATANQIMQKIVQCEIKLGNAWTLHSEYSQAKDWLEQAHRHAVQINDFPAMCDALCELGIIHWRLSNLEDSARYLQQGLELARQVDDKRREAYALTVVGQLEAQVGRLTESHRTFEAALKLAREMNAKRRIAGILNNYANTYYYEGNYEAAQKLLEECLAAVREIGDKRGMALALNNLGNLFYLKDDFETAQNYYGDALKLGRESDDKYVRAVALSSLGITMFRQGKLLEANLCYQESMVLNKEMGDKYGLSLLHCYLGLLALAQGQSQTARESFSEGLTIAYQGDIRLYTVYNLIGMASLFGAEARFTDSIILLSSATAIAESIGLKVEPELQEPYDKTLADSRRKLSEQDIQSAWEAGKTMDIAQAVQFALEK
ncbi:MAG TPA: tetratricopeptide repeat protein, partial [Anaerolineales bacterium]|nr:tetratricopeptide repeat protein [Anaerolineales bacterium]